LRADEEISVNAVAVSPGFGTDPAGSDPAGREAGSRRSRRARRAGKGLRFALWVVGALLFLAGACYGLRGPFVWGHYGYHAGEYSTRARHTLNNGSLLPGNVPGMSAPRPGTYYLHHPVLTPQLVTLTFALFGDNEVSLRLAALLSSAATLLLLSLFIRRHHGRWWGPVSLIFSALVPFNIWYAPHMDHGYPGLACVLAALLTYSAWLDGRRWRSAWGTAFWLFAAGNFDWTPFLFAVPLGLHVVAVAVRRRGRYAAFVPVFVVAVLLPAGLHALAVQRAHQWDDFFGAYRQRTASMAVGAFADVMWHYSVDLFGKPLLFAAAPGFLLALVDLLRGRHGVRPLALVSLVVAMALHLAVFRLEVVTHAYRLIYVAPAVVLGTVETLWWLHAGLSRLVRAQLAAWRSTSSGTSWRPTWVPGATTVLATLALMGATAPSSWQGAGESRAHGGIPGWKTLDPSLPRPWLMRTLSVETGPEDVIYLHPSIPFRMELGFYLKRDFAVAVPATMIGLPPPAQAHAVFAFVSAALGPHDWETLGQLAAHHPLRRYGPFGVLDLRIARPDVEAFALLPADPTTRSRWRAYWDGPYLWPNLAPEPLTAARDAVALGLPVQALGAHPPAWPVTAEQDAPGLVDARNYHTLIADQAQRQRDEAALGRLFAAPTNVPPPVPAVLVPTPSLGSSPASPPASPPSALPSSLSSSTRALSVPSAQAGKPAFKVVAKPVSRATLSRPLVRRPSPLVLELLGEATREGAVFYPALRGAGGKPQWLAAASAQRPAGLGRHVGQWVWERLALPADVLKQRVPILDLYAAPPGTASTALGGPFSSLVLPPP